MQKHSNTVFAAAKQSLRVLSSPSRVTSCRLPLFLVGTKTHTSDHSLSLSLPPPNVETGPRRLLTVVLYRRSCSLSHLTTRLFSQSKFKHARAVSRLHRLPLLLLPSRLLDSLHYLRSDRLCTGRNITIYGSKNKNKTKPPPPLSPGAHRRKKNSGRENHKNM